MLLRVREGPSGMGMNIAVVQFSSWFPVRLYRAPWEYWWLYIFGAQFGIINY